MGAPGAGPSLRGMRAILSCAMSIVPDTPSAAGFRIVLRPHRSLGPLGFWSLMAGVAAVSFVAGLAFYRMGAWPIMAFFGLDVLLVYGAFRISYRAARLTETLLFHDGTLSIERVQPSGRVRRWSLPTTWLRVTLEERPGRASRLILSSHGRSLIVGAFLPPAERRELTALLRRAIAQPRDAAHKPDS